MVLNSVISSRRLDFCGVPLVELTGSLSFIVKGCLPNDDRVQGFLDIDGLPPIGAKLDTGNPYYW